jgi:hypothetical protein
MEFLEANEVTKLQGMNKKIYKHIAPYVTRAADLKLKLIKPTTIFNFNKGNLVKLDFKQQASSESVLEVP